MERLPGNDDRLPMQRTAYCLGQACTYFSGVTCNPREELIMADGASVNTTEPPLRQDATFAVYGLICTGKGERFIAKRAEILQSRANLRAVRQWCAAYHDEVPLTIRDIRGEIIDPA